MSREQISLWRCESCGKWSHAKRRPKHHERPEHDVPDDEATVLRVEPNGIEPDTGAPLEVYIIACGPFTEYLATRVAS